jgi:beta-glucosidase-like glycosyl hydrolase
VSCVGNASDNAPPPTNNLCPDPKRFYCQTKHLLKDRIANLMSFMTLDDKIKTMGQRSVAGTYWDKTPLVARDYVWWNEPLHGLLDPNHEPNGACGKVCPTQFTEANALSCSWCASLWHATAAAISTKARAYFNQHANGGLTFYAPSTNMAAHPLWGRVMETPGEDPYLTSVYAKEYITVSTRVAP